MIATGVVAALSVAVITFAATTISTSISTGGTLSVTGVSTLTGGYVSTASSTVVGGLNVSGPVSASSTLIVNGLSTLTGTAATGGMFGVASSSPWGLFSVESVAGTVGANTPMFVIGDQGTSSPILYVSARGSIGLGTTTPEKLYGTDLISAGYGRMLTVSDTGAPAAISIDGAGGVNLYLTDTTAAANKKIFSFKNNGGQLLFESYDDSPTNTTNIAIDAGLHNVGVGNNSEIWSKLQVTGGGTGTGQLFSLVDSASTTVLQVLDNGKVGIGTTSPATELSISSAATTTVYVHSTTASKGGCIELKGTDGTAYRMWVGGADTSTTTTNGHNGFVAIWETGSCK
jgi:hypothetical protein